MSAGCWERPGPPPGWRVTHAGRQAGRAGGDRAVDRMTRARAAVLAALRGHARHLLSAAVLAAGFYFAAVHVRDFRAASHILARLRWPWIAAAVLCEAGSMLVLARLQRRLLRAGGARIGIRTMLGMTVAANAMAATLPGGVAWSAAWVFDQLSRHGVPRAQRVWMFLAAGAVSSFTLFAVVAAGIEIAGGSGPMSGLRGPALILAAIPVAGAGWLLLRRVPRFRRGCQVAWRRLAARSSLARRLQRLLSGLSSRLTAVRAAPGAWADALAMGLANWLLDAAVLVAVLQALAIHVPWHAILVIYGMTQVAGSLPVTPGGLGVVEGSLAGLLAAYGIGGGQALAAVMAYRLVSFWLMVPAGWLVWLRLSFSRSPRARTRSAKIWKRAAAGARAGLAGVPLRGMSTAGLRRAMPGPGHLGLAGAAMAGLSGATMAGLSGAALLTLPGAGAWATASGLQTRSTRANSSVFQGSLRPTPPCNVSVSLLPTSNGVGRHCDIRTRPGSTSSKPSNILRTVSVQRNESCADARL